jgi:hypothetical protein
VELERLEEAAAIAAASYGNTREEELDEAMLDYLANVEGTQVRPARGQWLGAKAQGHTWVWRGIR